MEKEYVKDDEIEIDLLEVLFAMRAKIWAILLALVIGAGLAVGFTKLVLTPMYTSTTMVYVLSKETTLTSLADLQIGSQLTKDYKSIITSRRVLEEVIDTLNLDMDYEELEALITIDNPADTRIMNISVEHPDPESARIIADSVAEVSSKLIGDIMEMTAPKIIDRATVAEEPSSPSTVKNALLGGAVAVFLVCGLIVLQVVMNDTIRTEEDVEKYLGLSVLAAVPAREEDRETSGRRSGAKRGRDRRKGVRQEKDKARSKGESDK